MKFLAKIQIEGVPHITEKEKKVFEQIKIYLNLMK